MRAEIITIGDEILIGQIVDTNSQWIGTELNKIGVSVHQISSIFGCLAAAFFRMLLSAYG